MKYLWWKFSDERATFLYFFMCSAIECERNVLKLQFWFIVLHSSYSIWFLSHSTQHYIVDFFNISSSCSDFTVRIIGLNLLFVSVEVVWKHIPPGVISPFQVIAFYLLSSGKVYWNWEKLLSVVTNSLIRWG